MDREQSIRFLQELGGRIAKELSLDLMTVGEDWQKGIWGESFTEYLEKTYGSCTEKILWKKSEPQGDEIKHLYVEFRFVFSDPCLGVHLAGEADETFAEIQLGNYNVLTKKHEGDFRLHVGHCFGPKGLVLLNHLAEEWDKANGSEEKQLTDRVIEEWNKAKGDVNE